MADCGECTKCRQLFELPIYHCGFYGCPYKNKPNTRDPILVEREKTHGDFRATAGIAQQIKSSFHSWNHTYDGQLVLTGATNTAWNGLPPRQKEVLEMIATKIARILSGAANEKDHWKDIAGYAKLGEEACD